MRDTRPVLLGMNNPLSARPDAALFPHPVGSTGWRLWKMAEWVCGMSRYQYLRSFDRRNLLDSEVWDKDLAHAFAVDVWHDLRGRRVLVLGVTTLGCLTLPRTPILQWSEDRGVSWCWAPHPSGLNHWYNEEMNQIAVGLRLESLYEEWRDVPVADG